MRCYIGTGVVSVVSEEVLVMSAFDFKKSLYFRGAMWRVFSSLSFACVNVLLKKLGQEVYVLEIVCLQFLFGFLFMLPIARTVPIHLFKNKACVAIGLCASISLAAWGYSMKNIPVVNVVSFGFLGSIFTAMGGIFIFKERVNWLRASSIVLGIIGGAIVAHGQCLENIDFSVEQKAAYILLPLISVSFFSALSLGSKYLVQKMPPSHTTAFIMMSICVFSSLSLPFWSVPTMTQVGWLVFLGIFTACAYEGANRALHVADVTFLMPLGSIRVVASALLGFLLFSEVPSVLVGIGSFVILTAVFLLSASVKYGKREKVII
ncbi:DMT family transporter [Candidatus Hydrogenosomobacter endosymbioticus]|uniref:EamA domain-containing protein n=1 Tax=Candidatus Hydrogenosomobacter endosymbioticus TaxID=2558174 RepID=A0ABM7V8P1_9PROT|nr:DMT family transporter [Candidatus Hydrogenosomobacter endosymbioticus]BDB96158.1 hypothetical protein HYD_2910 [Candidatus Hydrogenosomobacter endosymbioticus]